ncbi:MAG: DUF5060 domain-containing protein [Planctomycetes bacterium]|nr:DUF5060 domain-containing protein [Planctomycetota bacterium]
MTILRTALALLVTVAIAAQASAGSGRPEPVEGRAGEEPPLAQWRFETSADEWESRDARVARTHAKAEDGGYSLEVGVDFPRPASVFRRASFDIDRAGCIVYHVYVPPEAPENVKTVLFLKEKDGLWFQGAGSVEVFRRLPGRKHGDWVPYSDDGSLCPDQRNRGEWNRVRLDVSPSSPYLRPSAHYRLWDSVVAHGVGMNQAGQIGVKFFCDEAFKGALYLDLVQAYPLEPEREPLRVTNFRENRLEVGRYEKFELTFDINRSVTNPFDPDHVKIDATFRDPQGKSVIIPAFYYQNYVRRIKNDREELVPVGAGTWKVRFAPTVEGAYTYYLTVSYTPGRPRGGKPGPPLVTGKRSFRCVPSSRKGFIRVCKKDPNYFAFDNGEWFYPIGHNVHSPYDDTPRAVGIQQALGADILPDHGTYNYDHIFKKMADNGENLAEVWMCSWWLGLEWVKDWRNYNGLTRYNLHSAWRLDYLLELAERHDLYFNLVIDNHGKTSTWCDPEWEDNPYNELNGGFLASPEDYFRNPIAKENHKKLLRYLIARWGYNLRILGFELWSEIDLVGDSWNFHADAVTCAPKVQWHREMSEYLQQLDPWAHPVSTHWSTNHGRIQSSIASLPGIHYLATDIYTMPLIKFVLTTAQCGNAYGKPIIVTEYGGHGPFGSHHAILRAHLHAGIWSTYMTHTAGTPLLWWFQFIESDDQYWNFKALAAYHKGEERRGEGLVTRVLTADSFPSPHHDLAALALQGQSKAYVWVYSTSAMERMPSPQMAPRFKDISLRLTGLNPGKYRVEVWDTYKGGLIGQPSELATVGSSLTIPLPEFRTDCALKVKPQ